MPTLAMGKKKGRLEFREFLPRPRFVPMVDSFGYKSGAKGKGHILHIKNNLTLVWMTGAVGEERIASFPSSYHDS